MNLLTEEEIFTAAIQKPLSERPAFLDRVCTGDSALRAQVEALLAAHDKPDSVLDVPTGNVTIDSSPRLTEGAGNRIGPYKLLQQLGEGGMGAVYLAEQQQPVKRHVALKIIKAGMDSAQVIARFEQERQALAIMDHPHIAKVLDAGTTDSGRPYFVMELVKGIPITRYCDQEHLSPKERLELFIPVCQAVQHAHQKGIIHRDLKPSNVLIALYDGQPVPKVIDFGVAKATSQKLTERTLFTEVGSIVGTLEYMAPEQAELNNLDIDTRADIYSLGVLLYELLTGATPFSAKQLRSAGFNEMLRIIKEVEPPKPSTKISSSAELPSIAANRKLEPRRLTRLVQGDLDWIVMKCLEKERNRRYDTANAFALDIQRYLDDEPVVAGPPSARYRLHKFLRRNKGPVLAAALVLLLLVGGVVGTTWGLIRAEKSRQVAEAARASETARAETEAQQRRRAEAAEATAQANEKHAAAEQDRAEQEQKIAQAVKDFLQKRLLNQAAHENQGDALVAAGGTSEDIQPNPTIRELLDRAAAELTPEKIESQFPNLPLVQAEILRTIGDTYFGLSEHDLAIAFLERSRHLYETHRGPDHPESISTLNRVALSYMKARNLSEGTRLLEQLRDKQIATLGPDHPDTLTTLHNLGWTYRDDFRYADSIQLLEQVRDKRTAILGPDHLDTLYTMHELACSLSSGGRPLEAIPLFEHARDRRTAKLGPNHPQVLWTLWGLAWAYRRAGRLPEAIELFQQVHDRRSATLGPDHPFTLWALKDLALAYQATGKLSEAIQILEERRDKERASLGPDHRSTLITSSYLAWQYHNGGKDLEAARIFEQLRQQQTARVGPDHKDTLNTINGLAAAYSKLGKSREAIELFEQVRSRLIDKSGVDDSFFLSTLSGLAQAYRDAKKWPEAIQYFEEVRERQTAKFGPDHSSSLLTLNELAVTYRSAGRFPEAIQLYEQVRDQRIAKLGPDHSSTLTSQHNLAGAYYAAGRLPDAIQLFEQVREKKIATLGLDHPFTLTTLTYLALIYKDAGKLPEAIQLYEQAVPIARRVLGPAHASTILYTSNWCSALDQDRQFGKAADIRREMLDIQRKQFPAADPRLASALALLGKGLLTAEQFTEAEPVLKECLAIREQALPDDWQTFNTKSSLGGALAGQKKYTDAEPLLLAGYEGMKQREAKIPVSLRTLRLTEALQRLIDLYTAWDKPAEAAKWRKTLDEHLASLKKAEPTPPQASANETAAPEKALAEP